MELYEQADTSNDGNHTEVLKTETDNDQSSAFDQGRKSRGGSRRPGKSNHLYSEEVKVDLEERQNKTMQFFDPAVDAQKKGYEQFDQVVEVSDTKSETSGHYATAKASTSQQNGRLAVRKFNSGEPIG